MAAIFLDLDIYPPYIFSHRIHEDRIKGHYRFQGSIQ